MIAGVWINPTFRSGRAVPALSDKWTLFIRSAGKKRIAQRSKCLDAFLAGEEWHEPCQATIMTYLISDGFGESPHIYLHIVVAARGRNRLVADVVEGGRVRGRRVRAQAELFLPKRGLGLLLHEGRSRA